MSDSFFVQAACPGVANLPLAIQYDGEGQGSLAIAERLKDFDRLGRGE